MRHLLIIGGLLLSALALGVVQATAETGPPVLECSSTQRLITQFTYADPAAETATSASDQELEGAAEELVGDPVVSDELDASYEVEVIDSGTSPVATLSAGESDDLLAIVHLEESDAGVARPHAVEACA